MTQRALKWALKWMPTCQATRSLQPSASQPGRRRRCNSPASSHSLLLLPALLMALPGVGRPANAALSFLRQP